MPQWRKLHTRIRQSLDVNDMPDDFHRLLWSWLPLGLDREGRILDNPALVKAMVMPLREDVKLEQVQKALDWYADHGMIMRYSVNGRSYLHVPTFAGYQGRRGREAVSIYPAPPEQVQEQVTELVHDQVTERVRAQNRIEVEENRIDVEVEVEDPAAAFQEAVTIWEDLTGRITDRTRQQFADAADEYGEGRLLYAVQQAHDHNAKAWAYVEAVLKGSSKSRNSPQLSAAELVAMNKEYAHD